MRKTLTAALLTFCAATQLHAAEILGALGTTSQGGVNLRASIGYDWSEALMQGTAGKLTGYWDYGYTYWSAGESAGGRHSISFAPVFVYEFGNGDVMPFIEAGVGVALFSGASAGDQKLGSAFNFEDRIGAGLKIGGTQRIGIRAIHYSNAGIRQPNDGIESFSVFFSHTI